MTASIELAGSPFPFPSSPADVAEGLGREEATSPSLDEWGSNAAVSGHGDPSRVAYIRTANHPWEILSERDVVEVFSGRSVRKFFFSAKGYPADPYEGEAIPLFRDCGSDVSLLIKQVADFSPRFIYLQASPHTRSDFLIDIVKSCFPAASLFVEFYDISALFSDRFLRERGFSNDEVKAAKLACRTAMEQADVILHKQGGPEWDRLESTFSARSFQWFPVIGTDAVRPASTAPDAERRRVVYTGSIWGDEELIEGTLAESHVLLRALDALLRHPGIEVHVYNAAHRSPEQDEDVRFRSVRDWLRQRGERARYSRAVPSGTLRDVFSAAHFGLAALPSIADADEPLVRSVFGNRALAPLQAGLPVLVTRQERFMADTVSKAGAGLAFDALDPREIPDLIDRADYSRMRASAAQLTKQLRDRNERTLKDLISYVVSVC